MIILRQGKTTVAKVTKQFKLDSGKGTNTWFMEQTLLLLIVPHSAYHAFQIMFFE